MLILNCSRSKWRDSENFASGKRTQQQNNEELTHVKRSWISFYWIDKMRFILFVQQYTNFLRCFFRFVYWMNRDKHTSSTECIPVLLWCALSSTWVHGMMHGVLLFEICVFASCSFHFFLSFVALYIFISACCIRLFFLETSKYTLHTLTLALHCSAMHCLRPGKFQFYCTVCNLILLVYIINRWMVGWMAGQMASCFISYNFNFAYDRNACFKRDGLVAWNPLRNQPINYSIH